jgi:DNA-binding response OmpR family regulator
MASVPILIIDSDAGVVNAFGKSLGRQGFVVYGTTSACTGWAVLQEKQPRALIVDIQVPESQGLELLREAKILYPSVPVIVITAYSTSFTEIDARREGADGYFVKPFDMQALIEKLREIVNDAAAKAAPIAPPETVASQLQKHDPLNLMYSF